MKKLVIASNNKGKIKEIKELLVGINLKVVSLAEENIDIDVVEDGETFEENAKKKASEICDYLLERG
ncbi:MAG: non-canonical purine NTP pyrophosphatase, partial [Clostridium sp.]